MTEPTVEEMDAQILKIVARLWKYGETSTISDVISLFIMDKPQLLSSGFRNDCFWFWCRRVEESLERLQKQRVLSVESEIFNSDERNTIRREIRAVPVLDQVADAAKVG